MSESIFSKTQAIKFGWQRTKHNLIFFIVFCATWFVIQTFSGLLQIVFNNSGQQFLYAVTYIASILIGVVIYILAIKVGLYLYDNEKIESPNILSFSFPEMYKIFLAYFLYSILVLIGLFLLVIPGIYWAIKYQFAMFLIIDKNMGVIEAFKQSGRITQGAKWNLLLFLIFIILIMIAGALALLVGLFAAYPTVVIAVAYVYKKLSESYIKSSQQHVV
ncbi:MAG: hypothetical protein AAF462_10900 [Thermodesulfobacteriota bacterium]